MNNNQYINKYQKNQIETASQEQILIMLYNAAINFLNKAKANLTENNDDAFHHNMDCCKNIIAEFMNTLNVEEGGDWAQVLYGLYKYLRKLCITSDISKETAGIDEVLKHLIRLRDTWIQAINIANKEKQEETKKIQASLAKENDDDNSSEEYNDNNVSFYEDV